MLSRFLMLRISNGGKQFRRAGSALRAWAALATATLLAVMPSGLLNAQQPVDRFLPDGPGRPAPNLTFQEPGRGVDARAYNFHLELDERLANRFVVRTNSETSPVVDVILGAQVRGMQTTDTLTYVDFKPCTQYAACYFCLRGTSRSDTLGTTQIVQTRTLGCHDFCLLKPICFDGKLVYTRSPDAQVRPMNVTGGVRTPVSGFPLLGPTADYQAYVQVQRRRPQSESIAAQRLITQAGPKFNASIDAQLARLNRLLLHTVRPKLQQHGLMPVAQQVGSDENRLWFRARVGTEFTEAAVGPTELAPESAPLVIAVHESLLNALVGLLDMAGKSLTDQELDALLRPKGADVPDDANGAAEKPELATVVFDQSTPLEFEVANGVVRLIVRAGFQLPIGTKIATQKITIDLKASVEPDAVVITSSNVTVGPVGGEETSQMVRDLVRYQIEQRMKPIRLRRRYQFPGNGPNASPSNPAAAEAPALVARGVTAEWGWLILLFE